MSRRLSTCAACFAICAIGTKQQSNMPLIRALTVHNLMEGPLPRTRPPEVRVTYLVAVLIE